MTATNVRGSALARRLLLAVAVVKAVVVFAALASGNCHAADGSGATKTPQADAYKPPSPVKAKTAHGNAYQRPRIKWELLDFWSRFSTPPRRAIKSVSLLKYEAFFGANPNNPRILWQIDSDDPLVFQRTERGLGGARRSVLSDQEPHAYGMGNVTWGALRVAATDGEFLVNIYRDGFAMDVENDGRSWFESWTLSRVVDDLYVRKTGNHLDQKMLDELSGESSIRSAQQEYAKECEYLQKIAEYTAVLEKDRKSPKTYMARADAFDRVGRLDAAIADYTCAIELAPDDAKLWYQRGDIYYQKNDIRHAIADFTKAIQLNPKFLDAYSMRYQAYELIGDRAKANADLKVLDAPLEDEDKAPEKNRKK